MSTNSATQEVATRKTRSKGSLPRVYIDRVDGTVGTIVGVRRHIKHLNRDNEPELMTEAELAAEAQLSADKLNKVAGKAKREDVSKSLATASKRHLTGRAKELGIKGYSRMDQPELVAAICEKLLAD